MIFVRCARASCQQSRSDRLTEYVARTQIVLNKQELLDDMFNESGAVQAVDVVGGPTSEENKNPVRMMCVCVCVMV